ncbi:MAG: hypothetical protein GC156_03420 [Actinomycetales bacterium]|nr:hypothetical protein [Actinomycetales bacterium]
MLRLRRGFGALLRRARSDRGVTLVEYGILVGLLAIGMVGVAGFLRTSTTNAYNQAEGRVGVPASACIGDEVLKAGACVPNPIVVSSVTPSSGPLGAATSVTISGKGFAKGVGSPPAPPTVTFGGVAATSVSWLSSTSLSAVTPALTTLGPVDVAVTNPTTLAAGEDTTLAGLSDIGWGLYTYLGAAPTMSAVNPSTGSSDGGDAVTITGTNFAAGATVTFGGATAPTVTVVNATTITATTPAGTGVQPVVVTNVDGQSTSGSVTFTYTTRPTISGISPSTGYQTGGAAVTITGANFAPGASVTIGGVAATGVTVVNDTTITATTPAGTGTQPVVVTSGGKSSTESVVFIYTPVTAPAAPTITSITPGNGMLTVDFTAASNGGSAITKYQYSLNGGAWADMSGGTSSPLTITGLSNGTSYNVRIRAVNAIGPGAASNTVSASTFGVPAAPTITSITPGNGMLTVDFIAGANGGSAITKYQYTVNGGTSWADMSSGTTSPLNITGLSNGTTYNVQIRAVSAVGAGAASNAMSGKPLPTCGPITADKQYGFSSGSTWQNVSAFAGTGVTGGVPSGPSVSGNGSVRVSGTTLQWQPGGSGARSATLTFTYTATSCVGSGTGSIDVATGSAPTAPDAPTGVSGTSGNTQVTVTWSAPANDGGSSITGYAIQRATNAGGPWTTVTSNTASTSTTYTVTGLTNGTTYYFRVAAINTIGTGPYSTASSGVKAKAPYPGPFPNARYPNSGSYNVEPPPTYDVNTLFSIPTIQYDGSSCSGTGCSRSSFDTATGLASFNSNFNNRTAAYTIDYTIPESSNYLAYSGQFTVNFN